MTYPRTAENTAWMRQPWTCPKCNTEFPKSGGKGTHLRWCGKREDHFWSKVRKTDGCWLYEGTISFEGYGYVSIGSGVRRRQWQAHRFAWSLLKGTLAAEALVLHHCDVRNCVNPKHLYIGTRQDNMDDKIRRQRDTTALLTNEQAAEIKTALLNYRHGLCAELADKYGVSRTVISDIRSGRNYRHVQPFAAVGESKCKS